MLYSLLISLIASLYGWDCLVCNTPRANQKEGPIPLLHSLPCQAGLVGLNSGLVGSSASLRLGPQKVGDAGRRYRLERRAGPYPEPGTGARGALAERTPGITDSAQEGWFLTSGWPTILRTDRGN